MTQMRRNARPFTGRKMAAILVSFFAVVIAVNVLMARLASSTFGGVVVDNSYVASQKFNGWLKEAEQEQALGWKGDVVRDQAGRASIVLADSLGKPLAAAKVTAIAEHPLGQRPTTALALQEVAPGRYVAPLETGRWRLSVKVEADGQIWRTVGEVQ
ncbi:MAG: FixH family protein [Novosphingobium sp.]|uniref:FixH family protein n=1 Tax=Novosphingobium sp. TaxID=1874826 RepID=UPI003B99F532